MGRPLVPTDPNTVNDLTSMVVKKKKKAATTTDPGTKRKAGDESEQLATEKKVKLAS